MTQLKIKVRIDLLPDTQEEYLHRAWIIDGLRGSGLLGPGSREEKLDETLLCELRRLLEDLCQLLDRAKARLAGGAR